MCIIIVVLLVHQAGLCSLILEFKNYSFLWPERSLKLIIVLEGYNLQFVSPGRLKKQNQFTHQLFTGLMT